MEADAVRIRFSLRFYFRYAKKEAALASGFLNFSQNGKKKLIGN